MVVVGRDGRSGGDDAAELGRLIAGALGTEVLPVAVLVPGASPAARHELVQHDGARMVSAPSVAQGLSDVASEMGADAIVVGSSHRGLPGRVLFGTDARHVAKVAACPVALAPRGLAQRYALRLPRVDAQIDDVAHCKRAVELAGRIARREHGSVRVIVPAAERDAAERMIAALPGDVPYTVEAERPDPGDDADLLILGTRSDAHVHKEHACALLVL